MPIPLHPARVRERGFSQTFELAKVLSKELKKPLKEYIFRHSYRKAQANISSRDDRMRNVKGVFSYFVRINKERVLLVDDVITTGYTFYEAARTLIEAGARDVIGITLAKGG
ncbi:MAG: phosphoribosyltransferase family protein [candidate division WOR-3 bacterium]